MATSSGNSSFAVAGVTDSHHRYHLNSDGCFDESEQGAEGANAHRMPKSQFEFAVATRNCFWSALSHAIHFNNVHPFKVVT
jgi:hypothetical protein